MGVLCAAVTLSALFLQTDMRLGISSCPACHFRVTDTLDEVNHIFAFGKHELETSQTRCSPRRSGESCSSAPCARFFFVVREFICRRVTRCGFETHDGRCGSELFEIGIRSSDKRETSFSFPPSRESVMWKRLASIWRKYDLLLRGNEFVYHGDREERR